MDAVISRSSSLWSVRAVRWSVSLHTTALAVQLAAVLLFLSGTPEGFLTHSNNAWVVLTLGSVQLLAVLACGAARSDKLYSATAFAIVGAEALEIHLGRSGALLAHLTLAMIIWGLGLSLQIRTATAPWAAK